MVAKAVPPWLLLLIFYIVSIIGLWPGAMSPDADKQYAMAISGIYSNHHPPVMSLLWRYLDYIYPGPALIFTFHITMLYSAAAIFIYIFKNSRFRWWYAVYPIIPNILAYTALIVKDTGFTYSYLLSGAILSFMMINKTYQYKYLLLVPVMLLLCYGTAVKFQAQYILIFFAIGAGYCLSNYKLAWRAIIYGIIINLIIIFTINTINTALVPNARESHSWQLVKLYDLSAISLELNKPLYPKFVLQQSNFNFAQIQNLFDPREVDPLVFPTNSVLKAGSNQQQRDELLHYWYKTVTQHPVIYLKVRLKLFTYNLITSPSDRSDPTKFLATTSFKTVLEHSVVNNIVTHGFNIIKIALRFIWLLPLLAIYCYIAITRINLRATAAPLLMFSATSITFLLILLFCSMAGTARYVFLCTCLLHASHGFAYATWQKNTLVK